MTRAGGENKLPVVVVSSFNPGLAVIRSLGRRGVPVSVVRHSAKEYGYASKYVRETLAAPHPEQQEEQFIDFLISCATRPRQPLGGAVLVPTTDEAVAAVARHKEQLVDHYIVAAMEWGIAERFIDKRYTYALAEKLGVPAPRTIIPTSAKELEDYVREVEYPCLVKPRQGHRYYELLKKKMVKAFNFEELLAAYVEASEAGLDVMVQEFIPGDDTHGVNYNAYVWDGKPLAECTAEKVRLAPPEIGFPRVVLSKAVPEVADAGRAILEGMGVYGFACTEFKRDSRDGVYKLMEVNGRHNLSATLSMRCGVDFPWMMYEHLALGRLPTPATAETGVYWISDADILQSARYALRERYTLREYTKPYLSPHVFPTFDRTDVRPLLTRMANLGRIAVRSSTTTATRAIRKLSSSPRRQPSP